MRVWYALQTKPRKERALAQTLARAGVEVYGPRIRQWRQRAGRRFREEGPLFPGYLFVRLDFASDYPRIRWTPGLVRVVTSGGVPVPVGDPLLRRVREMEGAGSRARLRARSLEPGSRVRLSAGPFEGFQGQVVRHLSGGERVRILLELFRRQAALDCDPEWLQPVAAVGSRP